MSIRLTLVLSLFFGSTAEASLRISAIEKNRQPGHSKYLLVTDAPTALEHYSLPAANEVGITLEGDDIHESVEEFFRRDAKNGKNPCISAIQTKWVARNKILITFSFKEDVAGGVDIVQTKMGDEHHTGIDIHPVEVSKSPCTGMQLGATAQPDRKNGKWNSDLFRISAAMMLDYGDTFATRGRLKSDDWGFEDRFEVRRARITAKGNYLGWLYKVRWNFADLLDKDDDGKSEIDRAYIGYRGWDPFEITVGLQPEPFGLEKSTSSKYITFMERSLPDVFAPEDNLGVVVKSEYWKPFSVHIGAFKERPYPDGSKTDHSLGGRVFYDSVTDRRQLWHVGASYSYRQPLDNEVSYNERPEAHLAERVFESEDFENVDAVNLFGLEAALVRGALSLQGEYVISKVNAGGSGKDGDVKGYYAYFSWLLTGESRNYSGGNFGRLRPRQRVGKGGWGAWEVAGRYSVLEDDDGQDLSDTTLGLNWYLNKYVRAMFNWVHSEYQNGSENSDADILQSRLQLTY